MKVALHIVKNVTTLWLIALALSGCNSWRFTTDMDRVNQVRACPVRFRVSEVNYPPPGKKILHYYGYPTVVTEGYFFYSLGGMAGGIKASEEDIRKLIQNKAEQRYPVLFSEAVGALPISLRVDVRRSSSWFVSYLLQIPTLGQIPIPFNEKAQFWVQVYLPEGSNSRQHRIGEVRFSRNDHAWQSFFSPIGLVKIPGESARPKTSQVMIWEKARQQGGDLTLEGIADAIAQILQQRDLTPEIEKYIKSQRRF